MIQSTRFSPQAGQAPILFETGAWARQAEASVTLRQGKTVLLATLTLGEAQPHADFIPMTVAYRERSAALGQLPNNRQRREQRASEPELLISRLVDRALRPTIARGYRRQILVDLTVYSVDPTSDLSGLALTAAGALLWLSPLPLYAPVAGLHLTSDASGWSVYTPPDLQQSPALSLTMAGTPEGLLMLEGQAQECSEIGLIAAIAQGTRALEAAFEAIRALNPDRALEPAQTEIPAQPEALLDHWQARFDGASTTARRGLLADLRAELGESEVDPFVRALMARGLERGRRIDGREAHALRPLHSQLGVLPSNHGSALFERGATQVLLSATIASSREAPELESLAGRQRTPLFVHYNFPGFAVNEASAHHGVSRREYGHGHLARRALAPMIPSQRRYPFALRLTADVLGSDGSSSMATVCGASLALIHAGVPLRAPVAGVAVGALRTQSGWVLLTDINEVEDQYGDLDFKVAGTAQGLTAVQLDTKQAAVPEALLAGALEAARQARAQLLAHIEAASQGAQPSEGQPRHAMTQIPAPQVGALIGTGGRTLQAIQQRTRSRIEVLSEGQVYILSESSQDLQLAITEVQAAVAPAAAALEVGEIYDAQVVRIRDFGAFVRVGAQEALVHRSEWGEGEPKVGQSCRVRVLGTDERGRLRLSRRAAQA